jgi:hypothetical protein
LVVFNPEAKSMTSLLQRVLSLAAAATLSALSGEGNAAELGPELINALSPTFPCDIVSSLALCHQGIVESLTRSTVLVAEENPPVATQTTQPSPPPRDAITVLQERNQRVIDGLEAWDQKRRSLPPVPGG